ncbi:MAG: hypothetical protein WCT04_20870 [Planctomycetota bacterium]
MMKTMPTTKVKSAEPIHWVRQILMRHQKSTPDSELLLAIWMNPTIDPLYCWMNGMELVEIYDRATFDPEPEFQSMRFGPEWGMPGRILTLTSPTELNLDLELNGKRSYFYKLRSKLESGKAVVVFPNSKRNPVEMLEELAGPVTA